VTGNAFTSGKSASFTKPAIATFGLHSYLIISIMQADISSLCPMKTPGDHGMWFGKQLIAPTRPPANRMMLVYQPGQTAKLLGKQ